jgi:hypothetical protein
MGRSCINRSQRVAAQRRQDHRSEQAVLFASPHADLVSAQHPPAGWFTCGERRCGTLSDRPCEKRRSRRLRQAVDRVLESSDRGHPKAARGLGMTRMAGRPPIMYRLYYLSDGGGHFQAAEGPVQCGRRRRLSDGSLGPLSSSMSSKLVRSAREKSRNPRFQSNPAIT